MDVGGRLEARERRPQEVHRAARGALGVVAQDDQRPRGEGRRRREPRRGVGLATRRPARRRRGSRGQKTRTSCTPARDVGRREHRRQRRAPDRRARARRPSSLRSPTARCSRACPSTGSRRRRGRSPAACAPGRASSVARKSLQIDVAIGHEQELGQRQLPLAEDAEGAAPSPRAGSARAPPPRQRVIAGLAVRPQPPHRRHHQREQRRQQRPAAGRR